MLIFHSSPSGVEEIDYEVVRLVDPGKSGSGAATTVRKHDMDGGMTLRLKHGQNCHRILEENSKRRQKRKTRAKKKFR